MKKEIKKFGKLKLNKESLSLLTGGSNYTGGDVYAHRSRKKAKKAKNHKCCTTYQEVEVDNTTNA